MQKVANVETRERAANCKHTCMHMHVHTHTHVHACTHTDTSTQRIKVSNSKVKIIYLAPVKRVLLFYCLLHVRLLKFTYFYFYSRIIEDYHLKASQIYSLVGKKLASDYHLAEIEQLISCIQSSGISDTGPVCDNVLVLCVQVLAEKEIPGDTDSLIKLIVDPGNKVSYDSK
jgi:hypothetical protein